MKSNSKIITENKKNLAAMILVFLCSVSLFGKETNGKTQEAKKIRKKPSLGEIYVSVVRGSKKIDEVIFSDDKLKAKIADPKLDDLKLQVKLIGKLVPQEYSILIDNEIVLKNSKPKQKFSRTIDITSEITSVELMVVDPHGEISREVIVLKLDAWDGLAAKWKGIEEKKRHFFSAGLGLTWLSYSQTSKKDYSALFLTAKASYRFALSDKWDVGANVFFNLLPVTQSRTDVTARFLGINARAGYSLSFLPKPWNLSLMGGFYYVTMLVSGDSLGIQNLSGLQVFPVLSRSFSSGSSMYAYFKFSPVSVSLSILSLDSREIAVGGGYSMPFTEKFNLLFMLDFSNLQLSIPPNQGQSNTFSLSTGVAF